jgi:hypothetical protein
VPSKQPKPALDSFIAPPTELLKSSEFKSTLLIPTYTILYFYLEHIQSLSLALRPWHFRVAEISFYIENPHQFSNSVNGHYRI